MTLPPDLSQAAADICRVGLSLYQRGYVHATAGNISVRLASGFLITPTDACLGELDPQRLAFVDHEGVQRGGEPASKTLALHRRIYGAEPAAGCVVHTHSTHLVALSLLGVWAHDEIIPPITPYFVMKVGPVPLVPYLRPGHPEVADRVAALIAAASARKAPLRAVMLDRLGPVAWHRTPGQASAVLEELEETAKLWLACGRQVQPLSADSIEDLRSAFRIGG